MKLTTIMSLLLAPFLFVSCKEEIAETKNKMETAGDVSFARNTFESLCRGDSSVAHKIDWPVLTSMGTEAGAAYNDLTSQVEKDQFTSNFIAQFATSFRETGGKIEDFTNWRVVAHDQLNTEVAADAPKGVLSLLVSERDGIEKISSIKMID
ncbi:hypothetical protein V2O64_10265 [Verrucomicrobiaceae bacterium 227]